MLTFSWNTIILEIVLFKKFKVVKSPLVVAVVVKSHPGEISSVGHKVELKQITDQWIVKMAGARTTRISRRSVKSSRTLSNRLILSDKVTSLLSMSVCCGGHNRWVRMSKEFFDLQWATSSKSKFTYSCAIGHSYNALNHLYSCGCNGGVKFSRDD